MLLTPWIQGSRLLYYLISEIKTWLNINNITVHNNIFCILKLKEQLLKMQKLHSKQTSNLHNLHTHTPARTQTHAHTHTHARTHARTHAHTHTHTHTHTTALTYAAISITIIMNNFCIYRYTFSRIPHLLGSRSR